MTVASFNVCETLANKINSIVHVAFNIQNVFHITKISYFCVYNSSLWISGELYFINNVLQKYKGKMENMWLYGVFKGISMYRDTWRYPQEYKISPLLNFCIPTFAKN